MLQHSVCVYWQRHQRRFPRHNTLSLLCWWVPVSVSGVSPVISILEPIHTLCPNEFVGCGCCIFTHGEEKKRASEWNFKPSAEQQLVENFLSLTDVRFFPLSSFWVYCVRARLINVSPLFDLKMMMMVKQISSLSFQTTELQTTQFILSTPVSKKVDFWFSFPAHQICHAGWALTWHTNPKHQYFKSCEQIRPFKIFLGAVHMDENDIFFLSSESFQEYLRPYGSTENDWKRCSSYSRPIGGAWNSPKTEKKRRSMRIKFVHCLWKQEEIDKNG